jgi:hypothetical protein
LEAPASEPPDVEPEPDPPEPSAPPARPDPDLASDPAASAAGPLPSDAFEERPTPSVDPPSVDPPSVDPPSVDPPSVELPSPSDRDRARLAVERSFLAQPDPLKCTVGATRALRRVDSAPHAGQNLGPGASIPWITSVS